MKICIQEIKTISLRGSNLSLNPQITILKVHQFNKNQNRFGLHKAPLNSQANDLGDRVLRKKNNQIQAKNITYHLHSFKITTILKSRYSLNNRSEVPNTPKVPKNLATNL